MSRNWNVITITERRTVDKREYRADVTVDHLSHACWEQVHTFNGPDSGRLLHSCRFDIANLGEAADDANRIADYAKAMLGSVIAEQKRAAT